MSPLGFSTGVLFQKFTSTSQHMLQLCQSVSLEAIEINCLNEMDLPNLTTINPNDLEAFEYVSLHAPARNIKYQRDDQTFNRLKFIQEQYERLQFDLIVFHPDTIIAWDVFMRFDFPMAIENMDNRKSAYKDAADLRLAFGRINCQFVLDLNHCLTNDQSMQLAQDLLNNFSDRLAEIHLSGHVNYHYPLFKTEQLEIIKPATGLNVPIIIESALDHEEELWLEYAYIKNSLS